MRSILIAAIPMVAALSAAPAGAQVSARVHIDIPVGRQSPAYIGGHQLLVREYDPYRYGQWENYYDQWIPETVYLYDGQYYDYPIVAYAQPVVVYRFRNEIFFAPRQRGFVQWRQTYRPDRYRSVAPIRRDIPRDTRGYYNDRDRSGYRANGSSYGRDQQRGYGREQNGARSDYNGRDGHGQVQAAPQRGNGQENRSGQPANRDGRNGSNGDHRSRPRP